MKQVFLRTTFFVAAALAFAVTLSSFRQTKGYTITGQFKELPDDTGIELIPSGTHKDEKKVATAIVKGGKFVFTGSVSGPRIFFVKIAGEDYSGFQLMVENANIHVTGVVSEAEQNGSRSHNFKEIKVTGSKAHEQYLEKISQRSRLEVLYEDYHNKNKDIIAQMDKAREANDTVLQKQLLESDAYKQFEKDEKQFFTTVEDSTNALILANKNSWWGPFLMLDQLSYFRPEEKTTFEQFSKTAKESYYGRIVANELYPPSHVGKAAPSLAFVDEQKKPVSFASMAKGKRYIIIDFWASWCAPCRRAIPELKRFYEETSSKDVEIISVSIDKKESDWTKANNEEKFPWHSFLDRKGLADAYSVKAIPAMFLLDGNGKILAENVTLDQIKAKIN